MKAFVAAAALCVLALGAQAQISGYGTTTRYWDCCKPACAWREHVSTSDPVRSCAADGVSVIDPSSVSVCDDGGWSYACNNLQPWAVSDTLAYGFVAASFTGGVDNSKCCICLKLTFQDALAGKTLIVQNVNTGADLGSNQFDIQIPGGGVGIFTRGCSAQWGCAASGWGQQYGGISSDDECYQLPGELQAGCHFRFNWYQNADNPSVYFEQIECPYELTSVSGCSNNNF